MLFRSVGMGDIVQDNSAGMGDIVPNTRLDLGGGFSMTRPAFTRLPRDDIGDADTVIVDLVSHNGDEDMFDGLSVASGESIASARTDCQDIAHLLRVVSGDEEM